MRSALVVRRGVAAVLIALVVGWCGVRSPAQGFAAPVLIPTGNQPVFVATADFNGDGIPDLLYIDAGATAAASTTHVLLGDGKGGFKESAVLATAGTSVAVGKLLGTGHVDIGWLTSSQQANGVYATIWHIVGGVGDGTFAAPATGGPRLSPTGTAAPVFAFLKVADQSGQLKTVPSIVAEDTANNSLFAFPIELSGLEATSTQLPSGTGPIALGDLNGDTYDDIVVDALKLLVTETFLGAPSTSGIDFGRRVENFITPVQSLTLADFNGDGKLDIALEEPAGRIVVYAGNGDGTFSASPIGGTTSVDSSTGDGGFLIAAADLNKDGKLDLLTASPLGVSVLLGTASGNYTLSGVYPDGGGTHASLVTADFNGDGFLDVAMDGPGGIVILYGRAANASEAGFTLTATPEPSLFEETFTITANLAPPSGGSTPTGTVTFSIDGAVVGTPVTVANGVASTTITNGFPSPAGPPVFPGTHTLTASYSGDGNYAPNTGLSGSHTVTKRPVIPVLTPFLPTTVYFGGPVNGTVVFPVYDNAYPATGTWTLFDNGYAPPICVDISTSYQPGCPYGYPTLLNAGSHTFVITYNGDPVNGAGSSAPLLYTVLPDLTQATVTTSKTPVQAGQSVTFSGAVTSNMVTPQGLLAFMDGTTVLASEALDTNGLASFTTSTLAVGTHAISVAYTPLPINDPAQTKPVYDWQPANWAALSQVITPVPNNVASAVQLSSRLNPSAPGQTVTFTATVTVPGPFAGLVKSGTVTFLDGGATIGTGAVNQNGIAAFSTSTLASGSHAITASYGGGMSGSETILASTSPVLTQVVNYGITQGTPGFVLTVTPNPGRIPAGQTGIFLVTVRDVAPFNAPVTLSCSGLPDESSCTFVQATIPAGGGSTTLELATMAPHNCGDPSHPYAKQGGLAQAAAPACAGRSGVFKKTGNGWRGVEFGGPMLAGLLLLLPGQRSLSARLRMTRVLVLAVASIAMLAGVSGCSGNCTDLGTIPGSYAVTVTGTGQVGDPPDGNGQLTQSVTMELTVENP